MGVIGAVSEARGFNKCPKGGPTEWGDSLGHRIPYITGRGVVW